MVETLFHTGVKEKLIGKDPFNIEAIWEEIYWENHDLGSGGALTYLLAGLDIALWDLVGKALNVPVYKLLGGKHRDRIPVYAGFGIKGGRVPVEDAIATAVKLAERGFRTLKLRVQIRENNLNPDIIKSGGITELNKMATIAQVFHKSLAPHNTKPTLGTAAAVDLCCSITNFGPFIEFIDADLMPTITGLFENRVEFSDGMLHLPEGPGLGLLIREDLLEKIAVKQ